MSFYRKLCVFFALSLLFTARVGRSRGHSFLQRRSSRSEFGCVLTPQELQTYSGEEGRWLVTDSGFEALNGDIQRLVNCTEDGDVLLFDFEEPVQPSRRITVPWNLTISAFVEDSRMENGTFPEARRKTTILCPRENEGVFLVEASGCLFANLAFRNCSLNYKSEEEPYGIITIASCSTSQNVGTIEFHHLEFNANFLNRSAALEVQEPSCSGVQIIGSNFQNNFCIGTCAASLAGRSEIQAITLTRNRFFEGNVEVPKLIGIHSGSSTAVDDLTAYENNGTAVHVQDANLTLSNCHIFRNSGPVNQSGYDAPCVALLNSTGQILDSQFEGNTGNSGSAIAVHNSSIVVRRTSVIGNKATRQGGGISITFSSTVRILDSIIANNSAALSGGGVFSTDTRNLQIENTTLESNSAERGGKPYFEERDLEDISNSSQNNRASGDGAGLYLKSSNITFRDSVVINNCAEGAGGGIYIDHSWYSLTNLTLARNQAEIGGGVYVKDSVGSLNKSYIGENSVGILGGGLYMQTSNESVIQNCTFANNSATLGGGIYGTRVILASTLSCRFVQNRASHAGGGAYLQEGNYTLEDNTFEENTSDAQGGGFNCLHSTMNVTSTRFIKNNATASGGGSNVMGNTSAWFANCTWTTNVALRNGGGARFDSGPNVVITNSSFHSNQAEFGGGVYASEFNITLVDVFGNNNLVSESGAVLHLRRSNGTVSNCTFARNRASDGGAISAYNSNASIVASKFVSNEASLRGGAVRGSESTNLTINDCPFDSNSADVSGGSILVSESVLCATNLQFQNSTARYGGAFGSYDSTSVILKSRFVFNKVVLDGGAIDSEGLGNLTIKDCSFESNSADRDGGAIITTGSVFMATNLRFQNNRALRFGGAVFLQSTTSASLVHSLFYSESSGHRGGALTATGTVLRANNISITSCSAVRGGGVYLERTSANINETSVICCKASESGGGIRMIHSNVTSCGINVSFNSAVGTSIYTSVGGGIAVDVSSSLFIRNATLDGNMAQYGAGILSGGESVVNISNGSFNYNSARTAGGVAFLRSSSLILETVSFVGNSASFGGSVFATTSTLNLYDSQLISSSSTDAGGSILARGGSTTFIRGTTIQSSNAANGGGIMLTNSHLRGFRVQFLNCSATEHGGGVGLNESSSFMCTECLFEGNKALREGGALKMESLEPQNLAFKLDNTVFQNNDADFGGAINFRTGDGSTNCSDVNSTECTFLALVGCILTNNRARFAGGAILASSPTAMRVGCYPSNKSDPFANCTQEEFRTLSEFSSLNIACSDWTGNSASTYGPIVGSYAKRVSVSVLHGKNITEVIPGRKYVLRNHSSGYPLPTISLEAVDEFNQRPALIQANQQIETVMKSDRLFEGIVGVRMKLGRGNFPGITCHGKPGNHDIHINFSERVMPTLIIVVEIRHCVIGESRAANGTFCEPCGDTSYNFDPQKNKECITCPDDAMCDSRAIRPKNGYWHQTPCSTSLQRCLSERACNDEDRDARLKTLGSNIRNCTFEDEFVSNYSEALCREGYTGPLCGSCKASHGKTRAFRCEECHGRFVSLFLVIFAALVLLGLSAITINSALPTHKQPIGRNHSRCEESPSSPLVNTQRIKMRCTRNFQREAMYSHLRRHDTSRSTSAAQQQGQTNAELAKWKATEIFKITINYLQVIAIAIAVNVAWTGALIALFETSEFLGGLTSEAANHSTDCLTFVHSSIPRSAVRTIVNLIVPVVVGAIVVAFWVAATIRNRRDYNYLMKRSLLSILVVGYLSYIAITKTAANTLYCVDVHDSVDFENNSTTKYWAVDTALKCYDGPHNVLGIVFGFPLLVVFSLGFPVLVACVLIWKRRQEESQSLWLFETAGFLYRAYDKKFIFWESVILLRKAALAVIVVFAYPLGGNLQGLLAVCVLMLALYVHLLCSPYRSEFEALNRLEGLSLLISSLTFVSGLFLNDDRTSVEARATITAFVVLANVGIIIYFSARLFVAGVTYLGSVLEDEGVAYDKNATTFHIVKTFVKNRLDSQVGSAAKRLIALTNGHNKDANSNEVQIQLARLF